MKTISEKLKNIIRPFYYDSKTLSFKKLDGWFVGLIMIISISSFGLGWILSYHNDVKKINQYDEEAKLMLIKNGDRFSEEKLILFIQELNFKYPELVYAQASLESGSEFNSTLNKQNNNFFGMKNANKRINIQSGEQNGHAYYFSWRHSIIDYALFCATYLSDFKTKEEYYQYIERNYSETPGYVDRVKALEKQYFEKLEKIKDKNSFDFLGQDSNIVKNSAPTKHTKKAHKDSTKTKQDTLVSN